jgi:hypothetical protein
MSRGGHNWKGGGTVEGTRAIDVMQLARAGFLAGPNTGSWQWRYRDGSTASVLITGGRDGVALNYRIRLSGGDWQPVNQRITVQWTPCHFGGERAWFICDVMANGMRCGRRVAKLYGGGRFFACRRCYRLNYAIQRGGPMDRAHHQLARLQRKLAPNYDGSERLPPPKPKWMRWKTYSRIALQIEAGQEQLDVVFMAGAQRMLARVEMAEHRNRRRQWTRRLRRLR